MGPYGGVRGWERTPATSFDDPLVTGRVTITAPNVRIDGLNISGYGVIRLLAAGADLRNNFFYTTLASIIVESGDQLIARNQFTGAGSDGAIYSSQASNVEVSENFFFGGNFGPAINLDPGAGPHTGIVIDSNVSSGNEGLVLGNVSHAIVTNNLLLDLQGEISMQFGSKIVGVLLENVDDVLVAGNAVFNSPVGIQLGSSPLTGFLPTPVRNVVIAGNVLHGNGSDLAPLTGGIYATNRATPENVSIVANRIIDNSFYPNSGGIVADPDPLRRVNAENNWWGCNEGPGSRDCDFASERVDATPWLRFTLDANPSRPPAPGSSELRAHLSRNSEGQSVPEAVAFPPTAIDLTKVSGPGSISSLGLTTQEGIATATLSSSEAGVTTVRADVDFESVTTEVHFGGAPLAAVGLGPDRTPPTLQRTTVVPRLQSTAAVLPSGSLALG